MKKKILSVLLISCMVIGGLGSVTTRASEVKPIDQEEKEQKEHEKVQEDIQEDTAGEFYGEIEVDETAVNVVDENGNVTFVDMSEEDTIVEASTVARAVTPQIVNFRYKSGVIEYMEPATGVEGYTAGSYGADAAYLGKSGSKVRFMLAGVIGEVPAGNVQVLPKSSAKSVSYYAVSSGRLYHYISTNVNSADYGSTLDNGPAPSYLKSGTKYYSYDGHYFYTNANFGNMIDDYNKGTRTHSVNPKNPYYNYFQYLPLRSQSSYSGSALNTMLNNRVTSSSKMRNTGNNFAKHQNTYGTNALLMIGVGANESAWGASSIAKEKNNIFGLNAVDSSPGQSANYFSSVSQCIKEFAETWLSKQYLNPKNWKYYGAFLGNKASGMNVMYASDPYWGEKAASMAWLLDRSNGNKDANKYTIGIKDMVKPGTVVNVRKESTTSSTTLYQTEKNANCAFLILNNSSTNGFYKIQSEGVLNSGRTAINSSSGVYNYKNMYAYISSDYVKIVGIGSIEEGTWKEEGGKTYYYIDGKKVKGAKKIGDDWYYFDESTGAMHTGWRTIGKDKAYYHGDGKLAMGSTKINGAWYYFKENGLMHTGWRTIGKDKAYYYSDGKLAMGAITINGTWYYFKENGLMHTGWRTIGKDKAYYYSDGKLARGTAKIDGDWYYFKENGLMYTGWRTIGKDKAYYYSDGKLARGVAKIDGDWYYFKENGLMYIGWRTIGKNKAYYHEDGKLALGSTKIDGAEYYFKNDGLMYIGWRTNGKDKVYYHEDGKMAIGAIKIGGDWYYFKEDGLMHTGWRTIGEDKAYYYDDGSLARGAVKINGYWYYFKENGLMYTGWRTIGNDKAYYYEDGKLALGSTEINGSQYYFKSNGLMHVGWRTEDKKTYYYDKTGCMVTGQKQIDGKWYFFNEKGELEQ